MFVGFRRFIMCRILSFVVCVLLCADSFSQSKTTYSHNLFWGRIILADNITPKLRAELWIQKRTQDTEAGTSIFKAPQFDSYWLWFNYSLTPNLKLALSPFGYFESYVLYAEPSD